MDKNIEKHKIRLLKKQMKQIIKDLKGKPEVEKMIDDWLLRNYNIKTYPEFIKGVKYNPMMLKELIEYYEVIKNV